MEYNLGKVQIFIKNKNLHSNFTSPHSPHQNGAAERYWRYIFDTARALLLTSKLRQSFWVGAVDTVVYKSNRALLSALMMTKHSKKCFFFGMQTSVHLLKNFGSFYWLGRFKFAI